MDITEALQIVLDMARKQATTDREKEACDVVEDMIVNQFGDD